MHFSSFMDKYPIYSLDLDKATTSFTNVDEIIALLEEKIAAHPACCKVGNFDHYAHTSSLPEGEIADNIRAAKMVVFCFGLKLPSPAALAVRPRSIGVCELDDRFAISFMEAPNPQMNQVMLDWVKALTTTP